MQEKLLQLKKDFTDDLKTVQSSKTLDEIRVKYLGRKEGLVTRLFEEFKSLSLEMKREYGPVLNSLKQEIEQALREQTQNYESAEALYDLTVPAITSETGNLHPITKLQKEIEEIFSGLGFDVALGPEIESDFYNFEALNIPPDHPARDMQDTFYLDLEHPKKHPGKDILLRTHISNMQVRYMEKHKPPFAVILPGRVFRNEALDASHEHTYQYLEGFVVDKDINFGQMSWTLDYVMKMIFGPDVKTKLLPSYFPFVEPGAEMAISCLVCKGKGCSVCKHSGWVEILGCGMIHQKVFEYAGYKKDEYTGFAFGFGMSRIALMKYGIPDIRMLAENDLRFLRQF
jgi:phenylalanyl-tRNA synthetase alpha chain